MEAGVQAREDPMGVHQILLFLSIFFNKIKWNILEFSLE